MADLRKEKNSESHEPKLRVSITRSAEDCFSSFWLAKSRKALSMTAGK
jgi:hypothetical protein